MYKEPQEPEFILVRKQKKGHILRLKRAHTLLNF